MVARAGREAGGVHKGVWSSFWSGENVLILTGLHNSVKRIKAIEWFALKGQTVWYVKLLKKTNIIQDPLLLKNNYNTNILRVSKSYFLSTK